MDDWYFGYQCLNGCNPLLLRQSRLLPPNLLVTSDMLRPFLPEGSSLERELQVRVSPPPTCRRCRQPLLQLLCLDVVERDHLPAGLRGFGRRAGQ